MGKNEIEMVFGIFPERLVPYKKYGMCFASMEEMEV